MIKVFFYFFFLITNLSVANTREIYWELNTEKTIETRIFNKKNAYANQKDSYSVNYKSELFLEPKKNINFLFEPFYRYDHHDKERSLFDLSQGYFLYYNENIEFKIGKEKVFWGITELKNLVDIVNSKDNASGDEKSKLGQSLVSYSYINEKLGYIDLIYMPEFIKGTRVGKRGRLRLNLPTESYNTVYEGGAGEKVPSWAIKWQNSLDNTDISIQFFRGTSRDASTLPVIENGQLKYFAGYERISQIGTFIQKVKGPFIYKFEGIKRNGQKNAIYTRQNYYSYIAGIEYVSTRILKKIWDLNLFLEYSNDDRANNSTDIFQNDLFIGSRVNLNDVSGTEIIQALTLDLDGKGHTGNIEVSTRLKDTIRLTVNYNFYWSLENKDILYSFRRDNYLGIKLTNYF